MTFEFDPKKSAKNKADPNRKLDFVEAQALWTDPNRVEITAPFLGEPRVLVTGLIGKKFWTAVVTIRREKIRIIAVRRAHPNEEQRYHEANR